MEIYEMTDSQRENRIEELNIAIDNLLEATNTNINNNEEDLKNV